METGEGVIAAANTAGLEFDLDFHIKAVQPAPGFLEALAQFRTGIESEIEASKQELCAEFEEWCSDDCLRRFLIARNYNVSKAREMLHAALKWRHLRQPHLLSAKSEKMMLEGRTGKAYIPGKDQWGRPLVVLDHSVENSRNADDILLYLAFNLEFAVSEMTGDVEKYVIFVHMERFSFFNTPPMKVSIEACQMLSTCFPERLGHIVIYKPPAIFKVFLDAMRPFVDDRTMSKVVYINGDCSPGSMNDQRLSYLIGPNWRLLTGADQRVLEHNCSPGFNFSQYWSDLINREARIRNRNQYGNEGHLEHFEALEHESSLLLTVVDELDAEPSGLQSDFSAEHLTTAAAGGKSFSQPKKHQPTARQTQKRLQEMLRLLIAVIIGILGLAYAGLA